MESILKILYALLSVSILGALLGFGLAWAARKLKVEKDKLTGALEKAMPGLNCGACGYAGCSSYAEALAKGADDEINRCKPGGTDTLTAVAELLGREFSPDATKMVAQVHCIGVADKAGKDFLYKGINDCQAMHLLYQGSKSCKYGCLGEGSCIKVCPVGAISKKKDGQIWVDKEKCIACEKCLDVCPTHVMKMIPYNADFIIACNSQEKGKAVKEKCSVGCIGCGICARKFSDAGYVMEGNLPVINYEAEGNRAEAAEKCPVKCIIPVNEKKKS